MPCGFLDSCAEKLSWLEESAPYPTRLPATPNWASSAYARRPNGDTPNAATAAAAAEPRRKLRRETA
ncbi:Uncharacterised protein [Mycobacteroides abscessus subsp. abscessus]|nr:Uncharacterised protein [Mycobacteroides abscessus subsp. abscessus]